MLRLFTIIFASFFFINICFAGITDYLSLFNGKDLTGWKHIGSGRFVVENRLLRTEGGMGVLWYTKKKFGNCIIRVVYKTTNQKSNSGIFVRIENKPKDAWDAVHHGFEIQILDNSKDPYYLTGAIYSISKASQFAANPPGEWNIMEITLQGSKIIVNLNGKQVNVFDDAIQAAPARQKDSDPERGQRPIYGYIGLQNEDHVTKQADNHVYYKEITIKSL